MNTVDLLAYVGATTGIIGAVTGGAGAYVAYVSYKKTEKLKALDLRLELRKLVAELKQEAREVPALLQIAKVSHARVLSATGMCKSGAQIMWLEQYDRDYKFASLLQSRVTSLEGDYASFTPEQLESSLVEAHGSSGELKKLREQYEK